MIGPGALSQTRVSRVTVTLGAVGSAGFKKECKPRGESRVHSVCVHFKLERENIRRKVASLSGVEIEREATGSPCWSQWPL